VQVERFENSPVGWLMPISGQDAALDKPYSHFAYVPDPLPEIVCELTQGTYKVMEEASRALGSLVTNVNLLPNPGLLVRPAMRKEAVATSALEGTYAPLADALGADYIEEKQQSAEVREVMNYVRAANQAIELTKQLPICVKLLCKLQMTLVKGTRGQQYDSGRLREQQVYIGQQGCGVEQSRFVPPPPGDILVEGLSDWEKWLNNDHDLPILVKAALVHYQFETLHPFSDGNGRLGRLVVTLQLMQSGILEYPILNLSPWLEPRRAEYVDHLLAVSATGNFDPWVRFFCEAVKASATRASETITSLLGVRDAFVAQINAARAKGAILQLANDLIGFPIVSVGDVKHLYGIAYPTANNIVAKMVALGILKEVTGREYGRIFQCPAVYTVIVRA
jgi:Fic family protein